MDSCFYSNIHSIEKSEVIVKRNVDHFPTYSKDLALSYMTIGINTGGSAKALYDLHEVSFNKNDIAVVMPNHLLSPLYSSSDYKTTIIIVAGSFLKEFKQRTLTRDYHKFHLVPACHLTNPQAEQIKKMIDVIEMVSNKTTDELPNRHETLIYLLDVFFEILHSFRFEQNINQQEPREIHIFNQFCDLLAQHHRKEHEVYFYAECAHLTPKYFSSVIQKAVGVSAGEWIDTYLITQIKKVLRTRTELSVQQIAYEFGFNESASFCRFFKRLTGVTPTQYRKAK